MLLRENYTKEHIVALREQTGADPSINVHQQYPGAYFCREDQRRKCRDLCK